MSTKDPAVLLQDVIDAADKILEFTANLNAAQYERDTKTQWAVERAVLIIAEVAYRLRDDIDELCPAIPWHAVRGLGNLIRHGYEAVINRRIWDLVQDEVPKLRDSAASALKRLDPQLP